MKETSNACGKRLCCHGNGGSLSGRMHTVFPRVSSSLSRRVLPVQRPDSIDPHLLAFRSALDGTEACPPQRNSADTRKRGSERLSEPNGFDASCSAGARGRSDDSHVYENTRRNPYQRLQDAQRQIQKLKQRTMQNSVTFKCREISQRLRSYIIN